MLTRSRYTTANTLAHFAVGQHFGPSKLLGVLDELMAITIAGDYGSRLKSYELLAAAFGLSGASQRKVG
jgi:hypothetical protein